MLSTIFNVIGCISAVAGIFFCLLCLIAANGRTQTTITYKYVNCTEEEFNRAKMNQAARISQQTYHKAG